MEVFLQGIEKVTSLDARKKKSRKDRRKGHTTSGKM
jgi:hypothetical protein